MNSQDYRNLQEAYLDVYDSDLREEQEFESWIAGLLDEGYDLSDYNWDEMYEIYNEARDPGVKEYQGGTRYSLRTQVRTSNQVKPAGKKPPEETSGYGSKVPPVSKDELNFANVLAPKTKTFGRPLGPFDPAAIRNDAITSQMGKPKPEAPRRKTTINASYETDLYDVILEYLINEGYADTIESAERIMVNMSEDWRESICEANRGDEYATRGMSPEASKTWKSERRNRTRGFSSDVEEKEKNDERYKEKYGKPPSPDPNHMGGSQRRRQADTKDNRGKRTTLTHTTSDTLSPSGIKGTVTKPEIKIGTPLGGTQNPEPKGKYLHRQQVKDAQSPDPTKRARAPQNYLYHMN